MPKPLDERIAAAMSDGARIATVAELIAEVATAIEEAEAERDRLDAHSKSASVAEDEADDAADQSVKLARKVLRLAAKKEQLEARHTAMMASERRRGIEAAWNEAKAERDALAADLASEWPLLVARMTALLSRLKASDEHIAAVNRNRATGLDNLVSAEIEARGCTGLYNHPKLLGLAMPSIKEMVVPRFHADDWDVMGTPAWPPRDNGASPNAVLSTGFAQMEDAYRRRLHA